MPFPESGEYIVPGALQPVKIDLVQLQTTFSDMPAQGAGQLARKGLLPETIQCRKDSKPGL